MKIYENTIENADGNKVLRVGFYEHKACIYSFDISLDECSADLQTAKEKGIKEFLSSFEGKKFTQKEVLKAYSLVDDYFKDKFKELFPRGGSRKNAGRKQGSFQKTPKSDKTERFTMAITQEEKEFLVKQLERFRANR